jgi:hypothetical protein
MNTSRCLSLCVALTVIACPVVHARDAARDLSRMIGFTIVGASSVKQVTAGDAGEKLVSLLDGTVFKVQMLLLDPLPVTDVVIFAKAPSKEIIEKFGNKLPREMLTQYKLLMDNEVFDALLAR